MIVGVAISDLVDAPDKKMQFSMSEMDSADARWYKSLTRIHDSIGSVKYLKLESLESVGPVPSSTKVLGPKHNGRNVPKHRSTVSKAESKIISIEEIDEQDNFEDEGLIAFEKPDSDEEDEDEDPTLVQRNKPTAPV